MRDARVSPVCSVVQPAVIVTARSDCGDSARRSWAALPAENGSVVPAGGATVAFVCRFPVAVGEIAA